MAEFIIEAADPKNRNPMFGPTSERLRGRWSHTATGGVAMHESVAQIQAAAPEIPGIMLALDPQARRARRFDPLNTTPEGKRVWEKIQPLLKDYEVFLGQMQPGPELIIEDMSPDDMKTWLFEMRKLVDCGHAVVVAGSLDLPTAKEIAALPGKRIAAFFGSRQKKPEEMYADDVPVPVGKQPASAQP